MSTTELCELAKQNGVKQLAVTDINNTSACLEFIKLNKKTDLKPLVGIDYRNGVAQQYVGIARNNEGFRELNALLSDHLHKKTDFEDEAPLLPDCFIIYPFEKVVSLKKTRFRTNEFIGVSIDNLRKLKFSEYRKLKDKLVVLHTVSFRNKKDHNAHRLLRAIDNNTLLSKLPDSEQGSFSDQMLPLEKLQKAFEEFPHIVV